MAVCKGADLIEIAIAFHEDKRSRGRELALGKNFVRD